MHGICHWSTTHKEDVNRSQPSWNLPLLLFPGFLTQRRLRRWPESVHSWILPSPPGSKCVPCHLLPSLGTLPSPEWPNFKNSGEPFSGSSPGAATCNSIPVERGSWPLPNRTPATAARTCSLSPSSGADRVDDTSLRGLVPWRGRADRLMGSREEVPAFDLLLYFLRQIAPCRAVCFRLHSTCSWS